MSRLNPGRLAAVRALVAVDSGAHAEDVLAQVAPPSEADRALAWHLVLGVLRRRGAIDALLDPFLKRGVDGLDPPVRAALRVGAFELKLARTADHAAVDQAVEACAAVGSARARGLVNAVLRKATRAPLPDDPALDLPPWLAQRWAEHTSWLRLLREPPAICGAWRDLPVEGLTHEPASARGEQVRGTFRLVDPHGPVPAMPGFTEGRWWVMDPSAARVADLALEAAGAVAPRVLDACAAPGGKAFRLAAAGAIVTAVDASIDRLDLVDDGARRLDLALQTRVHDWLDGPIEGIGVFDVVLVDAPCTGLGTVRRHPEIRWRRLPSDPAAMALRQLPILRAAARHVAPGGALVYAVCSPEAEEGRGVTDQLSDWRVEREWRNVPPQGDEDAFQAFVLRH